MSSSLKDLNKNVVNILKEEGILTKIVYDEDDKTIRLDVCTNFAEPVPDVHHIPLNRKQAVKMIKLLEEFLLWNPK